MRVLAALTICVVLTVQAATGGEPTLRLEKVTVHVFLENSGAFSDDITSIDGFAAWNYIPSGGSFGVEDRFHSFLIKVWLASEPETFRRGEQGRVTVKEQESGKVVLQFPIKDVYVGKDSRTVKAVLVSEHVCTPLDIEVRCGAEKVTKRLPFKCGE